MKNSIWPVVILSVGWLVAGSMGSRRAARLLEEIKALQRAKSARKEGKGCNRQSGWTPVICLFSDAVVSPQGVQSVGLETRHTSATLETCRLLPNSNGEGAGCMHLPRSLAQH